MEIVTVKSIPIVLGREEDGRWWADICASSLIALTMPNLSSFSALKLRDAVLHRLDAIIQGTHDRVTLPVTKVRSSRPLKKLSQQPRLHGFRVLTQFAFRLV